MQLVIADFKIRFTATAPLFMDEGYTPFLNELKAGPPDLEVECVAGLPVDLFDGCDVLFEAQNDQQRFYTVVKYGNSLGFKLFDQQTKEDIQQLAILDETFRQWTIYCEPRPDGSLEPMKYPMGPILLYYLVVNNHAIMIHASGVFDGNKGRIFTGFSGTGKSTMAEQWRGCGSSIINDDRLIVRRGIDGYYLYNTPMYYFDLPKSAPLHAIHLIRHFPENITQRITGAKAVSKVMAYCIQNNFDKKFIQNYIDFISELCQTVGIYETGFVPDHSIVRYLQTHE